MKKVKQIEVFSGMRVYYEGRRTMPRTIERVKRKGWFALDLDGELQWPFRNLAEVRSVLKRRTYTRFSRRSA